MVKPAIKPISYEDILQLPDNVVGEIINGRLETHPRPAPKHALAASCLGIEIGVPFYKGQDGPGGWWILGEPELHLQSYILVPDLAGWRKRRMPVLPTTSWFEVVPDWVCEILSPSTARLDRVEKMPIYAELGVRYLWLIDPDLQTLEAYQLHEGLWLMAGIFDNDATVSVAPFDACGFSLANLWAPSNTD